MAVENIVVELRPCHLVQYVLFMSVVDVEALTPMLQFKLLPYRPEAELLGELVKALGISLVVTENESGWQVFEEMKEGRARYVTAMDHELRGEVPDNGNGGLGGADIVVGVGEDAKHIVSSDLKGE